MKTEKDIDLYITQNGVDAWRTMRNQYSDAAGVIESSYVRALDRHEDPKDTIIRCVKELGYDLVLSIFASLINIKQHDGRIRPETAEWAAKQEGAWDSDCARLLDFMYLSNFILAANLEQLGRTFIAHQKDLVCMS